MNLRVEVPLFLNQSNESLSWIQKMEHEIGREEGLIKVDALSGQRIYLRI